MHRCRSFYMILLPSSLLNSVFSLVWTIHLFVSYILSSCSLGCKFFSPRKFINAAFPVLFLCLVISNAVLAGYNILEPLSPTELSRYCSTVFFFKDFFFFDVDLFFLKTLLSLLQYSFSFLCFGFLAPRHVGS